MTRLWKCFVWDSFKVTRIDGHADLKDLKGLILIDPYRMTRLWKCFVWDSFKVTSIDGHADLKNWKDWFGLLIWIMRSLHVEVFCVKLFQGNNNVLKKIRVIRVIRGKKLTHSLKTHILSICVKTKTFRISSRVTLFSLGTVWVYYNAVLMS